jgi:hypothetical protein
MKNIVHEGNKIIKRKLLILIKIFTKDDVKKFYWKLITGEHVRRVVCFSIFIQSNFKVGFEI